MALLYKKEGDNVSFADRDMAEFTAEMYAEGHSPPDSA